MASQSVARQCIAVGAMFLLSSLAGCRRPPEGEETTPAVPVEVMEVASAALEETTVLSGVLEAIRGVDVVPEVSGRVAAIHRDVGQPVRAGEPLASLDGAVMREALNQSDAALMAAESRHSLALEDLARDSTLFGHGDIPQAMFDASRMAYTAAKAELKAARAARALAERSLRETDIRAPFAGSVARRFVDIGAFATPGMPAFRVVNIDSLRLVLNVAQHHVGRLSPGSKVSIVCEGNTGIECLGSIRSIGPEADMLTGTFPVEVVVANPPGHPLRGGLIVRATAVLGALGEGIAVPRETVIRRTGAHYVFVVEDSIAHQRPVTVGALIGERYVIQHGLKPNDVLVISGVQNLHDKAPVLVEGRLGSAGTEGSP